MNGKNENGEKRKARGYEEGGRKKKERKKKKRQRRRSTGAIKGTNGKLRAASRGETREEGEEKKRKETKKKRSEIMV